MEKNIEKERSIKLSVTDEEARDILSSVESDNNLELAVANKKEFLSSVQNEFEHFTVLDILGSGGSATVVRARNSIDGKIYAIKILNKCAKVDQRTFRKLENISEKLTKISHENIVGIYRWDRSSSGFPYMVMDCIEGSTLKDKLESNTDEWSIEERIDLMLEICRGVAAAHDHGIIHCDIKPSNVILESKKSESREISTGTPYLVDFGISQAAGDAATEVRKTQSLTMTGQIVGSPQYMSPEQCLGFKLDERSDIYSLGCLFYEIICGKSPFAGENSVQVIVKQLNSMPSFEKFPVGDFSNCKAIASKCLAKDKSDRYQSMEELIEDLENLRQKKPVKARCYEKEPPAVHSRLHVIVYSMFLIFSIYFLSNSISGNPLHYLLLLPIFSKLILGMLSLADKSRLKKSAPWKSTFVFSTAMWGTLGLIGWLFSIGAMEFLPLNWQWLFPLVLIGLYSSIATSIVSLIGQLCFEKTRLNNSIACSTTLICSFLVSCLFFNWMLPLSLPATCELLGGRTSPSSLNYTEARAPRALTALIRWTGRYDLHSLNIDALARNDETRNALLASIPKKYETPSQEMRYRAARAFLYINGPNQPQEAEKALTEVEKAITIENETDLFRFLNFESQILKDDLSILKSKALFAKGDYENVLQNSNRFDVTPLMGGNHNLEALSVHLRKGDYANAINLVESTHFIADIGDTAFIKALVYEWSEDPAMRSKARQEYETLHRFYNQISESENIQITVLKDLLNISDEYEKYNFVRRAYIASRLGLEDEAAKYLHMMQELGLKKEMQFKGFADMADKSVSWDKL